MPALKKYVCWMNLLPLFFVYAGHSQSQKIIAAVDSFRQRMPMEKIYLHTDKPNYALGDTIWYKSYLFNSDLEASAISRLIYIELCTDSGRVVLRQLIPAEGGVSWGNIIVSDNLFAEGSYTLRGYTNWMQNFGNHLFFIRRLQIYNTVQKDWLIGLQHKMVSDTLDARLQLNTLNGSPVSYYPITLNLKNGKKTLYKNSVNTNGDGSLLTNFYIPKNTRYLRLEVKDAKVAASGPMLSFPVPLQRPENTDLQFLPEGGNLVAGIQCRIAFKAVGEDGKATEVLGKIYNSKRQEITEFNSTHSGMGSFTLKPEKGEKYTAVLNKPTGTTKAFNLPEIMAEGTALFIDNLISPDSIIVQVNVTDTKDKAIYYIVGQSRNTICFAAKLLMSNSAKIVSIPKSAFPTGIARFSLLTEKMQPVNERLVFINHHDELQIFVTPHQLLYTTRDSIGLAISVKDMNGKPVEGSFSLSVTDDSQVKTDSTDNILVSMLLTGDLKAEIENGAYYFSDDTAATKNLDNLLLTQGWTGYDWQNIFIEKNELPVYKPEKEFSIRGKVSSIFNKGVSKTGVTLFSKKPFMAMDTLTNTEGEFSFASLSPVDTALFFLQARNKSGRSMNVDITVDEFKPPAPAAMPSEVLPWYVNTTPAEINYAKATVVKTKERLNIPEGSTMLQEVIVKGKKIISGSFNLNGPGQADQVIDKEELEKAGKITLGDLIRQKVKGFSIGEFPIYYNAPGKPTVRLSAMDPMRKQCYLIDNKQMRLIIDGYDVDFTYQEVDPNSRVERFNYIQSYLNYYTAEEIKGIEVMSSKKYNDIYNSKILSWEEQKSLLNSSSDIAYLEITTHSGHGPFVKKTPGIYLYKPLFFSLPKQFYRPKYSSKQKDNLADVRSTIHWQPNVITDTKGEATVSFFSSDRAGTYTIKIDGSDMNGNIGSAITTIKIN